MGMAASDSASRNALTVFSILFMVPLLFGVKVESGREASGEASSHGLTCSRRRRDLRGNSCLKVRMPNRGQGLTDGVKKNRKFAVAGHTAQRKLTIIT